MISRWKSLLQVCDLLALKQNSRVKGHICKKKKKKFVADDDYISHKRSKLIYSSCYGHLVRYPPYLTIKSPRRNGPEKELLPCRALDADQQHTKAFQCVRVVKSEILLFLKSYLPSRTANVAEKVKECLTFVFQNRIRTSFGRERQHT